MDVSMFTSSSAARPGSAPPVKSVTAAEPPRVTCETLPPTILIALSRSFPCVIVVHFSARVRSARVSANERVPFAKCFQLE